MESMVDAALLGAQNLFKPYPMLALISGSLIGLASGALPGASLPGLIILLSIAFGMDPSIAIPLAVGMTATVSTSDTLPSVVLGIPGSSSSQATIMDGYPMAQQGRAGEALGAGYLASLIGGIFAAIVIVLLIPGAREVIGNFRAPELLTVAVLGIAMVGILSSGAFVKGLVGAVMGLGLSTIGIDVTGGTERFTFDSFYLFDGVALIIVIIGVFAVPELIGLVVGNRSISTINYDDLGASIRAGRRKGMAEVLKNKGLVLRSAGMGVFAGLTPGIGQATVDWFTYVAARMTLPGATRTFGTGDIRGVIAPESANNATAAATFVPAMAVGIPVGIGSALLIGLLITLGFSPGPNLMRNNLDLIFLVVFSLIISNTIGTAIMLLVSPFVARITFIRAHLLVPVILSVLMVASFQVRNTMTDLFLLLGMSVLGWHMKRYGWARPPLIIGLILGPVIELNLVQGLRAFGVVGILQRPGVWAIAAVALTIIAASLKYKVNPQGFEAAVEEQAEQQGGETGQASGGTESV